MSDRSPRDDRFARFIRALIEDRAEFISDAVHPPGEWDPWLQPIPVVVDVLLSPNVHVAAAKLALATESRYPWISVDRSMIASARDAQHYPSSRSRFLSLARRTIGDPEGIDLLWRLVASVVGCPLHFGFVPRLLSLCEYTLNSAPAGHLAPLSEFARRGERLDAIQSFIAGVISDPFECLDYDRYDQSYANNVRMIEAAVMNKAKPSSPADARETAKKQMPPAAEASPAQPALEPGRVRIIASDVKATGVLKRLADNGARLHVCDDAADVRERLRAEFPHATAAIDLLTADLRSGEPVRIRPVILVGPPGCGKSRMARALASAMGLPCRTYDCASVADNTFAGTSKQWSTSRPSFPLTVVAETCAANPVLLLDEIEKSGTANLNGNLSLALIGFTEKGTARVYPDLCLEAPSDLSYVNYVGTANDDSLLPAPLRDRFRIVRVPAPGLAQLPDLCRSVLTDILDDAGLNPAFAEPLATDELEVIAKAWSGDRSIRTLQRLVAGTLAAREACASRH